MLLKYIFFGNRSTSATGCFVHRLNSTWRARTTYARMNGVLYLDNGSDFKQKKKKKNALKSIENGWRHWRA